MPGIPGLVVMMIELETGITIRSGSSSVEDFLNPSEAGVCLAVHHFLNNVFSRTKLMMLAGEEKSLEETFERTLREIENAAALYISEVFDGEHHRANSTAKPPADWNAQFAEMIKGMSKQKPEGGE
jgi:hypothetical protein